MGYKPEDSILIMLNDDGVAEIYDDTYDITIHCTSEEEQKRAEEMLKNCMRWIPIEERLPEDGAYCIVSFENFHLWMLQISEWMMRVTRHFIQEMMKKAIQNMDYS